MKKNVVIEILKIVICYQAAAINHPGQRPIHQFKTRRVQNQTADLNVETCKVKSMSSAVKAALKSNFFRFKCSSFECLCLFFIDRGGSCVSFGCF